MSSFDLRVNTRDPKSGQVISSDPYRLIIENGMHRYERPPGSGIIYAADGTLISEPKEVKAEPLKAEESKGPVSKPEFKK